MTNTGTDGQSNAERRTARIGYHPLVEALVADAANPRALVLLVGYAGPSDKRKLVRLYLDPDLEAWVDVLRKAVRRSETLPSTVAPPFGASVLWLDPKEPALQQVGSIVLGGSLAGVEVSNLANLPAVLPRLVRLLGSDSAAVLRSASGQETGQDPAALRINRP
jgi:hypothetical protein